MDETNLSMRVLVVDDNYYNVYAVTAMLLLYQIDADTASDGNEAISLVKALFL